MNDSTLRTDLKGLGITSSVSNVIDTDTTLRVGTPSVQQPNTPTDEFVLNGVIYHSQKTISDNSGEAQVYLVYRDGKLFVLKLYYPNVNIKTETLKVVANMDFNMIVRLYDFGKVYVDGKKRNYELMEYLRGGTLNTYCLNEDFNVFRRLALQAAAALACCHTNNLIHKDIKPGNFFFRDDDQTELVLGDFGISSVMTEDGTLHRTTQARTPMYAAPEMYNDVIDGEVEISTAADYYSLGITLMTLWMGKNPLNTNERLMMKRKNEGRLPGINELPERVRMIITGLTAVNPESRWTYQEVEKWFLGESPAVDISSPFLKYRSFVVDPERNIVADNVKELVPLLMENEQAAKGYLYNGKLTEWLEKCGNTSLSIVLQDVVKNRYPIDKRAGLITALYLMDPKYPYVDKQGKSYKDIHSIVLSMLENADEYSKVLKDRNHNLWLYIETHVNGCNIERMRNYFYVKEPMQERKALLRVIYEIDPDIPLFAKYKSNTLKDIVYCFGYKDLSDDEWESITDGRLLSWMYSHEDYMACESLRIMTEGQPYSKQLAYKVLYNLDHNAAYDLRDADTPEKVGELLSDILVECQRVNENELASYLRNFTMPEGRFSYFAQMHGWAEELIEVGRCFDLNSEENRERLSAYDLRTAAYRVCRVLGANPEYMLSDGSRLKNGLDIDNKYRSSIRTEIRQGYFPQWLATFYHENPKADFSEEYSYELMLEKWIKVLGEYDAQISFFKRYTSAKEETARKYDEIRTGYKNAMLRLKLWRYSFYGLCAVWMILLVLCGCGGREQILNNSFITICLPLGGMSAVIMGAGAFFRGYGFFLSFLWGVMGFASSHIPVIILRATQTHLPSMFIPMIIFMTLIYMLICHVTGAKGESKEDGKLINRMLEDDVKSSLLEPLYYTFKTKSYKFKGSKFGILDDVQERIYSVTSESIIHYAVWCILVALILCELIIFNSSYMNISSPFSDNINIKQSIEQPLFTNNNNILNEV